MHIFLCDPCPIFSSGLIEILKLFQPHWSVDHRSSLDDIDSGETFDLFIHHFEPSAKAFESVDHLKKLVGRDFRSVAISTTMDAGRFSDLVACSWDAILLGPCRPEELMEAISTLQQGERFYNAIAHDHLLELIRTRGFRKHEKVRLGKRDEKILKAICEQKSSKVIAIEMGLAEKSVEKLRGRLMQKTRSRNMAGLVVYAVRMGYYIVPDL